MSHLFEFMDQQWLPSGLRSTLREIMDCGNSRPFRTYYQWVADATLETARKGGYTNIVELGAGTAPITRHLAKDPRSAGLRLIPCDINPDESAYQDLELEHRGQVEPIYESINFSRPHAWQPNTLLILSATFHHIASEERKSILCTLNSSADKVLIFEPLRRTWLSGLFVFGSLVPAIILPIMLLSRSGRFRRLFWCWLVPIAPMMFWWDGLVSCIRQWTNGEWEAALRKQEVPTTDDAVQSSLFCQMVTL